MAIDDNPTPEEAKINKIKSLEETNSSSLDIPRGIIAPVYPYNKTTETESGHLFERDDTPGAERISEYHKNGTGYQIQSDGTKVSHHSNDRYSVVMGSDTLIVSGHVNIIVSGDAGIKCSGDMTFESGGDMNFNVGGDMNIDSSGDMNTNIEGQEMMNIGGDSAKNIQGFMNVESTGDYSLSSASVSLQSLETDVNILSENNLNFLSVDSSIFRSGNNFSLTSKGDTKLSSGGKFVNYSSGDSGFSSGGSIKIFGKGETHLTSNSSLFLTASSKINTSPMVEVAKVSLSALKAPEGPAGVPIVVSGGGDNGAESNHDESKKGVEKDKVEDDTKGFEAIDTEKTQKRRMNGGYSGGISKSVDFDKE